MIFINLFQAQNRLPHPLATARRIAEVGGFFNSKLSAVIGDKDALSGTVCGEDEKNRRVEVQWKKSPSNYTIGSWPMEISIKMDGLPTHIKSIVHFKDLQDPAQWRKLAETLGNIITDNLVHNNTAPPDSYFGKGIEDDPDITAKSVSEMASELPKVGPTDGGTE